MEELMGGHEIVGATLNYNFVIFFFLRAHVIVPESYDDLEEGKKFLHEIVEY
jgi:hypothetical protein